VLAISFEAWYSDPRRKCLSFCLVYQQKTPASLFFCREVRTFNVLVISPKTYDRTGPRHENGGLLRVREYGRYYTPAHKG
jgi:hypothetical protein